MKLTWSLLPNVFGFAPSSPFALLVSHVGAEGLDELIRICRPGGVLVLTVKNTLWENGFAARIGELASAHRVVAAEETPPYVSMPGETGTIPSRGLALRITGT